MQKERRIYLAFLYFIVFLYAYSPFAFFEWSLNINVHIIQEVELLWAEKREKEEQIAQLELELEQVS